MVAFVGESGVGEVTHSMGLLSVTSWWLLWESGSGVGQGRWTVFREREREGEFRTATYLPTYWESMA